MKSLNTIQPTTHSGYNVLDKAINMHQAGSATSSFRIFVCVRPNGKAL